MIGNEIRHPWEPGYIADGLDPFSGQLGGIGFTYLLCAAIGLIISLGSYIFSDWRKIGDIEPENATGELEEDISS